MKIVLAKRNDTENVCVLNFGYEDESKNAHWSKGARDIFIFHYVISGAGFFNSEKIKAGNGFLIIPGKKQEYHSSLDEPWSYLWISFTGSDAENIAKKYVDWGGKGIFEFDLSFEFLSLKDRVISESSPISSEKALGYFYFFLSQHGKRMNSYENRYVEAAKKYMSINISRSVSITEVASEVGVNDRYLYNLFIKHEKESPKKYLSRLKLSRAELMLRSTRLTISEIAADCGFSDVLAFSRFFSKNEGVSPSEYRNRHLESWESS